MPQFAVNSQLATRNPKPAVLLSPQGRVGTWKISPRPEHTLQSPSPQGRVGTEQEITEIIAAARRRPLKVGSGQM